VVRLSQRHRSASRLRGPAERVSLRMQELDTTFLHKSAAGIHERRLSGLFCQKGWAEGAMDVEVALQLQHGKPLDQTQRCQVARMAAVDETPQGLLNSSLGHPSSAVWPVFFACYLIPVSQLSANMAKSAKSTRLDWFKSTPSQ